MKFIGFATKMYTLWNRVTNVSYTGEEYYTFTYIKNISKDLDEAKRQYPDAEVDLTLKGTRDITRGCEDKTPIDPTVFQFGKYRGQKISECTDYGYLAWMYQQVIPTESSKIIEDILNNNGYHAETKVSTYINSYGEERTIETPLLFTNDEWNYVLEVEKENEERKELLKNGTPIEFTPDRNLDDLGRYYDGETRIDFEFENFKEMYYNGYGFGLPLDSKGKAKRIKNKRILVKSYEIKDLDKMMIVVKDFEIVK